jgi:hypothetical protein
MIEVDDWEPETYDEIYRELVYERNDIIDWLYRYALMGRKRAEIKEAEKFKHEVSLNHRELFRKKTLGLLNKLHLHDATEAVYDFESIELGDWADSETNRLELELRALQKILGKLEIRYGLTYRVKLEYISEERTLYLNGKAILSPGASSIKHRLLTTLYSEPEKAWSNDDIEEYFIKHFDYTAGELKDTQIRKSANDINTEVALKSGG